MERASQRQALLQGALAGALTFAVALAAVAPSRWVLSGLYESPRWQELLLGLAADGVVVWLPCFITWPCSGATVTVKVSAAGLGSSSSVARSRVLRMTKLLFSATVAPRLTPTIGVSLTGVTVM